MAKPADSTTLVKTQEGARQPAPATVTAAVTMAGEAKMEVRQYDTDLVTWSERQAELLRRRAAGELVNEADIDWLNVAEEIDALGKRDARELASRITTILIHLIKLEVSTSTEPRAGWRNTILTQQTETDLLLEDSPSLRRTVADVIEGQLATAKKRAVAELAIQGETVPAEHLVSLTFAPEQVLPEIAK